MFLIERKDVRLANQAFAQHPRNIENRRLIALVEASGSHLSASDHPCVDQPSHVTGHRLLGDAQLVRDQLVPNAIGVEIEPFDRSKVAGLTL
jgi:hypothetical protein